MSEQIHLPTKSFQEMKKAIYIATDTATNFEMKKAMLKLKCAILVIKNWESYFRFSCAGETPSDEVFLMMDEIEFLLENSQDELQCIQNTLRSQLETAHAICKTPKL